MNMIFHKPIPGMQLIPGSKTLYQWDRQQPLVFKPVANLAQALTAGGFIAYHEESGEYAWFLGDTARRFAARGVFFYDHLLSWKFQPGDGETSRRFIPSGVYSTNIRGIPRAMTTSDVIILAVVSNAPVGYGGSFNLYYDPEHTKSYPAQYGRDDIWPINEAVLRACAQKGQTDAQKATNRHRGSIMVPVALPKKRNEIVKEQRSQLVEGSGKGQKYIDAAIDNVLRKPDEILYIPMITTWRGKGEGTAIAVGHTVRDIKSSPASMDWMISLPTNPSADASIYNSAVSLAYHATQTGERFMDAYTKERTDRPPTPAGATLVDSSWSVYRSFEGRLMDVDGVSVPCPFVAEDYIFNNSGTPLMVGAANRVVALNSSLSTYAGIDTSWLLKGALPWFIMNVDGSRKANAWTGALGLNELLAPPDVVKMPSRDSVLPPLAAEPSASDIKQRAQDEKAAASRVVPALRVRAGWEDYFSPVAALEKNIAAIYDEAYRAAEAAN